MILCLKCNSENSDRSYYCKYCGEPLKLGAGTKKRVKDRFKYVDNVEVDISDFIDYFDAYRPKRVVEDEEK